MCHEGNNTKLTFLTTNYLCNVLFQILSGVVTESRFEWPEEENEDSVHEMKMISETDLKVNDVAFMDGKIITSVENK